MKVPIFKQYFAMEQSMDTSQKQFYNYWKSNWENGKKIPIDGQISYVFCYVYDILSLPFATEEPIKIEQDLKLEISIARRPPVKGLKKDYIVFTKKAIKLIKRIINSYQEEEKLAEYCKLWLSDCFVILKEYQKALDIFPRPNIDRKSTYPIEKVLNLKLIANGRVSGYDILTLNGPKVTEFGKRHVSEVSNFIDIVIKEKERSEKYTLLNEWRNDVLLLWKKKKQQILEKSKKWGGDPEGMLYGLNYPIFVGSFYSYEVPWLPFYRFSESEIISETIINLTREAENTVREEYGIPRIGEGWVAETELYYNIKKEFPRYEVIHHARPKWIGKQHLDIFIPKKKVAIEYQGSQHYKPIDFFGGQKAFEANKRRDKAKKQKCTKNKVKFIEVSKNYKIKELIEQIKNH